jgi:hypothetical protein
MRHANRIHLVLVVGFVTVVAMACGTSPSAPTTAQTTDNTTPAAPAAPTPPATPASPGLYPTIVMTWSPVVGHAGVEGHVTLQVSDVAHDAATVDFGDGTKTALGDALSANLAHVYASPGTYVIVATVTANTGTVRGTVNVQVVP